MTFPKLPLTGSACTCKRGIERDNCPTCEGTGRAIDWAAYWRAKRNVESLTRKPENPPRP